jgi:mono/diheme cytochrome c family protein
MNHKTPTGRSMKAFAVVGCAAIALGVIGTVSLAIAARKGFSAREQPSRIETLLARTMRSWSMPSGARDLKNPVTASAEVLAEARAHWADHCATCHSNNGSGDTQIGKNLYPKAPDMRAKATQQLTDGELYFIIENGIRLTGMPAWGHGGKDDDETWNLVAFIRHLSSLTPVEERQMERLNPKSVEEREEEEAEGAFLKGRPAAPTEHGQHKH